MLLQSFLARIVHQGTLTLIDGKGKSRQLGDGGMPCCTLRLAPDLWEIGLMVNPALSMAEAYIVRKITIEDGSIGDLLEITLRNYQHLEQHPIVRAARILGRQARPLQHYNPIRRARHNVAHHKISQASSTICSWIQTCNTPARISRRWMIASKTRSYRRSAMLRPSFCLIGQD